jgi:hypothetical protein
MIAYLIKVDFGFDAWFSFLSVKLFLINEIAAPERWADQPATLC